MFSLIGPKRYDAPWKDIEAQGWIAPADCVEVRVTLPTTSASSTRPPSPRSATGSRPAPTTRSQVVRDLVAQHPGQPTLVIGQYIDQLDELAAVLDAPVIKGETPVQGAPAALRGLPHRRGRAAGGLARSRTSPSTCPRPRSRSRSRAPSGPARRRPSASAGCCDPRPRASPRTSTRSSPATPSTPSSPRTGSASWPSRGTPTGSSTRRTCRPEGAALPPPGCVPVAESAQLLTLGTPSRHKIDGALRSCADSTPRTSRSCADSGQVSGWSGPPTSTRTPGRRRPRRPRRARGARRCRP